MMKNIKNNFEWLSILELKKILKSLVLYKDLSLKMWSRGKTLFSRLHSKKDIYKIEYFDSISKNEALKQGLLAYEKIFDEKPNPNDIIMKQKSSLSWWIRIYKNDNMSDISFKKLENILI